jgi:predicted nucleic acid-binding protein
VGLEAIAVADAGPLIHLDELGALDLLASFERVLIPDVVRHEVARHRAAFSLPPSVANEIRAVDASRVAADCSHLQDGEMAALALCKELGVTLFLTDDLAARDAARALGVTPVGSLGIVLRAARIGIVSVDLAERYLVALSEDTTLFTTPALIAGALRALRA